MKRYYLLTCLLAASLVGCKEDFNLDTTIVTSNIVAVHSSTVDMQIIAKDQHGDFTSATVSEYGYYLSDTNKQPSESDILVKKAHSFEYNWDYTNSDLLLTITGLAANTTYYARPFISNKYGAITGEVVSFTTNGTAKVTTKAATQITTTTVQLNATVELVGERASIEKRGFVMSTSGNPEIKDNNSTNWAEVGKAGDYSVKISDMQSSTRYYFRGYVVVDGETLYGNVLNFTTLTPDDAITLSLNNATDITDNSAKVSGSITIGKDAVGQLTECGFIAATDNNPTFNSASYKAGWWNSDVNTWSGQKNMTHTFQNLSQATTYYYRLYYKIGTQYYYDNTIKSFRTTGSSQSYYTVSQIMSVYNTLGLASGATSTDTYTVRGYVTKWNNGYPDYQNADFFIDDSANGSTSNMKCFRLTGVNESDKRTLVVGDYIEAQNCHLMNYNGQAELKDGTFTVIKTASSSVPKLSDFLGTYSCHAHRHRNNDYVDWNNVIISSFIGEDNNEWIMVEGLIYGQNGYYARGKFEEATGTIHLYGGYYDEEHTCTISAKGDALLYPVFYPMYVNKADTSYLSNNENDVDFMGEILLVKNGDGTISLQSSDKADSNGRYANVYRFNYFLASDLSYTNYNTIFYLLDGTTLTKTSSATSAPVRIKSRKVILRK